MPQEEMALEKKKIPQTVGIKGNALILLIL